nr:hypothetical protein [uncultured Flavobacterium sp.]
MNHFFKIICISLLFFSTKVAAQTLTALQMQNARATGYAIVAAKNPGKSFSVFMVKWDGVHDLEYNANNQINPGWHAQAAIKGNYFDQAFVNSDFTIYSSVVVSQSEFDAYKATGTDWWIVCSTLPAFSNTSLSISDNGNLGIGANDPKSSLTIRKSPGENDAHLFFGEPMSISGLPSSRLCFAGTGIQNANFTWVPNSNINEGKLFLSFGPYENGIKNPTKFTFQSNGNVGIGTTSPAHKLDVIGTIRSREVKVDMNGADFVFEEKYSLMPLSELEAYVKKNKHLPEIATAKEMQEQGSNLGDLNTKLLQKIEELTLYVIEQEKKNTIQSKEIEKLKKENESYKIISDRLTEIEKKIK